MRQHQDHGYRHLVVGITYSKPDAAVLTCSCGFSEMIGVWHHQARPGWDAEQWDAAFKAATILLDSLTKISEPLDD